MIGLALALMIQAEPPPFLQFIEEAEALGRASYMGGICSALKIVESDAASVTALVDDFRRRAIMAKTDGPIVEDALTRGVEREKAASAVMIDFGPDDGSERRRRREDQAADYFGTACADLTINYPEAFKIVPSIMD